MLRDELLTLAEPVLAQVLDHPFWSGLRDGSLPGGALAHFVHQDTRYLLPAYGRAHARLASLATEDTHMVFFARSACGAVEAANRLRTAFTEVGGEQTAWINPTLGAIDPLTHAHCSFFHAATANSLPAGIGALLPMTWFNYHVCHDLAEQHRSDSHYGPWIARYQPPDGYFEYVVQPFLDLIDELDAQCSAAERRMLVEHYSTSIQYEWMFAESAWRRPSWPV